MRRRLKRAYRFIAERWPHYHVASWSFSPKGYGYRIFGFKPECRFTIFDITSIPEIGRFHITIMGWRIIEHAPDAKTVLGPHSGTD